MNNDELSEINAYNRPSETRREYWPFLEPLGVCPHCGRCPTCGQPRPGWISHPHDHPGKMSGVTTCSDPNGDYTAIT